MTHFLGAGTIASDIVRKETRNGVVATFRLRSGAKGRGQVWIDVEAWGHLAGTVHRHGKSDRPVIVAGRLAQKTWHDRATGEARHRYVITANDIDLLPDDHEVELANTAVAFGTVDSSPTTRPAGTGTVTEFRLATGRAGSRPDASGSPSSTGIKHLCCSTAALTLVSQATSPSAPTTPTTVGTTLTLPP